jgi:hypothetical protein
LCNERLQNTILCHFYDKILNQLTALQAVSAKQGSACEYGSPLGKKRVVFREITAK